MKCLLAAAFAVLLAGATVSDVSAQERSKTALERILSAAGSDDGRTPTVIMDEDERTTERRRGRTARGDGDVRQRDRADRGRGTVNGRGTGGDVKRSDSERGRTQTGAPSGDSRRAGGGVFDHDVYEKDDRENRRGARGQGPKFCRSGEGHPLFGRAWCQDKGFGLGGHSDDGYYGRGDDVRYPRRDNVYGDDSRYPRRDNAYGDGGWLEDILDRR